MELKGCGHALSPRVLPLAHLRVTVSYVEGEISLLGASIEQKSANSFDILSVRSFHADFSAQS
jgi:hypothetical protein